jgi:yecA family protein
MTQIQGLEYHNVAEALRRASISMDAADCHGFLCGLICAAGFADQRTWVDEFFEAYDPKDPLQAETHSLLQKLYENTLIRLNSPDLDFELLLPDDQDPLCERTESLANWCSGFLSGLGMGGLPAQDQLSDEVAELLGDLSQISRVDFDLDEPDEEEQVAFEEVVEYVRVGVLFVHEELQPGTAAQQTLQ